MNCQLCGRPLTNSTSVIKGIGPNCINKLRPSGEDDERSVATLPFDGDVICMRNPDNGNPATNINQLIVRHSPTGFEWGYSGSGPADFALNILLHFVCLDVANMFYQRFKEEFIAPMAKYGGEIKGDVIREWLAQKVSETDLFKDNMMLKKKPFATDVEEIMKIKAHRERKARVKKEKKKKRKAKKPRKIERVKLLNKSVEKIRRENKARFVIVLAGTEDEVSMKVSNGKMSRKLKAQMEEMIKRCASVNNGNGLVGQGKSRIYATRLRDAVKIDFANEYTFVGHDGIN